MWLPTGRIQRVGIEKGKHMRLYSISETARLLNKGSEHVRKLIEQNKLKTATWKSHVLVIANGDVEEAA
jgi:hypothetical protein